MTDINQLLAKVYKDGFNIYQLISRMKKQLGWGKDRNFPDEVLVSLCHQYFKDKNDINNRWCWFVRVLAAKSSEYYANKNVEENQKRKKESMPESIREIMMKALQTQGGEK